MTQHISIAFYNLENFFDTYNDPHTADDPFTPKGLMHWVKKRFQRKSKKIAYTITQIGLGEMHEPPLFIGLAEVENKRVLKQLVHQKFLRPYAYDYVHFDSGDRRGMDVALLFRKDLAQVLESKAYPLILYNNAGKPYRTRDILYVKVQVSGEIWHVFINHWPSRREGDFESDFKRQEAADKLSELIDYVYYEQPDAKFVILGDFNTDPDDPHLCTLVDKKQFLNPALSLFQQNKGSLNHHGDWHLFDQIILSANFKHQAGFQLETFGIFNHEYLKIWHGKQKGHPYRTYKGRFYQGGYSDHFPVYAVFRK